MTELLKKDKEFIWGEKQQKSFEELKNKLVNYLILQHPNYKKNF